MLCYIFFFKQKTAYEMRISDWSSDVCSSDLIGISDRLIDRIPLIGAAFAHRRRAMFGAEPGVAAIMLKMIGKAGDRSRRDEIARLSMLDDARAAGGEGGDDGQSGSQERRVGTEYVSMCRSRWTPHD